MTDEGNTPLTADDLLLAMSMSGSLAGFNGSCEKFVSLDRLLAYIKQMNNYTKVERHDSRAWRVAVSSLPCQQCGIEGRTQCAHRNQGKGLGIKTDDCLTAALCVECHTEIDQGSRESRAERRERMDALILKTLTELARRGLVVAA